jgi:hypothetical protein
MSRDRHLEIPHEHGGQPQSAGGREMPRGGRSGGTTRRPARPVAHLRDALAQQLDLPRGEDRERVWAGTQPYDLRGSEVRTLATIGAFRVVETSDVQTGADRWHRDLEHLREARLVEFTPKVLDGRPTTVVTLTREGQTLLERHQRAERDEARQSYYSGLAKPRELAHDARLYRAYATAASRLDGAGARIRRVVLDYELKREYQRFLQSNNREHKRSSGRPDRSREEIRAWADEHGLAVVRDRVQFPDVRIEYERPDGERGHEDLELATGHYNGRQMAAKRASGFTLHHSRGSRIRGAASRSGGSPFDPHSAEQVLG